MKVIRDISESNIAQIILILIFQLVFPPNILLSMQEVVQQFGNNRVQLQSLFNNLISVH